MVAAVVEEVVEAVAFNATLGLRQKSKSSVPSFILVRGN